MPSVIIIGSGPAGISASLYTARAGIDTTVISAGAGALKKAKKIENYYGFSEPVLGEELERRGIEGARRLGVKFIDDEVVSLAYNNGFIVRTPTLSNSADCVLIATGAQRSAPPIAGLKDFEGRGVSYCAVCDGFFFRRKSVGVLGSGEYALNEVKELLNVTDKITVFTNGEMPAADFPDGVCTVTEKIEQVYGEAMLNGVRTDSGAEYLLNGLFIAYKTAGSTALAKKIGAAVEGDKIKTDEKMRTTVKGLYAAGDCTGGILQISKAVYDGMTAGTEIIKFLKTKK